MSHVASVCVDWMKIQILKKQPNLEKKTFFLKIGIFFFEFGNKSSKYHPEMGKNWEHQIIPGKYQNTLLSYS